MRKTRWTAFDPECYLLPADWFARWSDYVNTQTATKSTLVPGPGPIDTSVLLSDSKEYYHNFSCHSAPCNNVIRESMEEGKDFYVVSRDIWSYLFNIYGGTPLKRENIYVGPNGRLKPDIKLEKVARLADSG